MSNEFIASAIIPFAEPGHNAPSTAVAPATETPAQQQPWKPAVFNNRLAAKTIEAALEEKPFPNIPLPAHSYLDHFRTRSENKRHPAIAAAIAILHPMPSPWTMSLSMMKPPPAIMQPHNAVSTPRKTPERPTPPPGTPPSMVAVPGETRRNRTSKFPIRQNNATAEGEPPENYPLKGIIATASDSATFVAKLTQKPSTSSTIKR